MEIGVRKIQKVNFEGKKNLCENLLYIMSLCDCKEPVLLPTLHTKQHHMQCIESYLQQSCFSGSSILNVCHTRQLERTVK